MKMSGDERMAKAEKYFRELAARKVGTADQETYEQMRHVAETVQETLRLLEHVKMQMEDLRHKVAVP